jgi:hypothetical protein
MLLICVPLLIFSTANPVSTTNLVERAQVRLGIVDANNPNSEFDLAALTSFKFASVGYCDCFILSALNWTHASGVEQVSDSEYQSLDNQGLIKEDLPRESVQKLVFVPYSASTWDISPPSKRQFTTLVNNSAVSLTYTTTMRFIQSDSSISQASFTSDRLLQEQVRFS